MECPKSQLVAHASQFAFHQGIAQKDPKAAKALGVSLAFQFLALNRLLTRNSIH
jgi:hypothetical protein